MMQQALTFWTICLYDFLPFAQYPLEFVIQFKLKNSRFFVCILEHFQSRFLYR